MTATQVLVAESGVAVPSPTHVLKTDGAAIRDMELSLANTTTENNNANSCTI